MIINRLAVGLTVVKGLLFAYVSERTGLGKNKELLLASAGDLSRNHFSKMNIMASKSSVHEEYLRKNWCEMRPSWINPEDQ